MEVRRTARRVSFEIAATVIHSYDTAYYALADPRPAQAGETVVVTGAGGGVGMAAVDVALHLGGRVIAAVGSARHTAAARARGRGDRDYARENVRERLAELTGGKGIDVCFDNVGGALFETLARSMAWRGRLLPIGFVGGEVPKLAMNLPLLKNFSVVGVFAGAWEDKEPEAARQAKETIMALDRRRPPASPCRHGRAAGRVGEAMRGDRRSQRDRPHRREGPLAERALGGATPLPQTRARSDMEPRGSTLATANGSHATANVVC